MPKRKLTVTLDAAVLDRARAYSRARRTSVSRLVADYLDTLTPTLPQAAPGTSTRVDESAAVHPDVRAVTGAAGSVPPDLDADAARWEYLSEKYGPLPPRLPDGESPP